MKAIEQPNINQSDFNEFLAWKRFKDQGCSIGDLTYPPLIDKIPDSAHNCQNNLSGEELCMKGAIRSLQSKCPKCKGKFVDNGRALVCPTCLVIPDKYFVDIHYEGQRIKLYRDKEGFLLDSYRRANRLLENIRHQIDNHTFYLKDYLSVNIKGVQFENNINEWLKRQEIRLQKDEISPSYYEKIASTINKYFIPFFKKKDIRDIRSKDVEDFYLKLPSLALKTQKNIIDLLHKYFNDLLDREEISRIPKIPKITVPDPHWNWVAEDLQNMIFDKISDEHKPIFAFIKEHGLRPSEARAIHKEDIHFENGTATIRRNFSNEQLRLITKNKRQRIIPIQKDVLAMLKKLPVLNGFLFLDENGKRYKKRKLERIYNKARNAAGIKNLTLYQWGRHSFASQAINNGTPENIVGAFLGHSDSRMTKRYAHTNIEGLKIIFNKKSVRGPSVLKLRDKTTD